MKKTVILAFCLLLFLSGCQVADKTTTTAAPDTTASSVVTTTTRGPISATAPPTRKTTTTTSGPQPGRFDYYHLEGAERREDEVLDIDELTIDRLLSMYEGLPFEIEGAVKCWRVAYISSQGEDNFIILFYYVSKYDPDKEGYEAYERTGAPWNNFIEYYETEEITSGFFSGKPVVVKKALRNIYNGGYNMDGNIIGALNYIDMYYGYMYGSEEAGELWTAGDCVCFTYARYHEEETQMFYIPYIGVPEEDLEDCSMDGIPRIFYSLLAFRGFEKNYYNDYIPSFRE
jgi:hypothetical protein